MVLYLTYDDVMFTDNAGIIIRIPVSSVNIYKRDVQVVIIMLMNDESKLARRYTFTKKDKITDK